MYELISQCIMRDVTVNMFYTLTFLYLHVCRK